MPTKKKPDEQTEIFIRPLQRKSIKLRIIGTTPLIMNRMPAKAMQTLLVGGQRKTKADRVEMKHNPPAEYRTSVELMPGTRHLRDMPGTRHSQDTAGGPTLAIKATAIKGAMCTAALETPGMTKTGAQRLLFMPADHLECYGTPQLRMDVVRSADINKTPDIRTRAELQHWGTEVELQYIIPQLSMRSVITLLCNAGLMVGVGDGRQEKGRLNRGLFRVLGEGEEDAEWDDLVAKHGRAAQLRALHEPEYANEETAELMEFFFAEEKRQGCVMLTRKDREAIIRAFTARHGGQFDPGVFIEEVEAAGERHPAWGWFEWDDDAAARQYRLEQARAFTRGIRVSFRIDEIGGGRIRVRELMVPAMLSPLDRRQRGGGYVETESGNPDHLAEFCQQAARDLEAWSRRYASAVIASGASLTPITQLIARLQHAAMSRDEAA